MGYKLMLTVVIGVFATLAVILGLQGMAGGEWTVIAQEIAPLILAIAVFAVAIAVVLGRD